MNDEQQLFFQTIAWIAGIIAILSAISTISSNVSNVIPIGFTIVASIATIIYWKGK